MVEKKLKVLLIEDDIFLSSMYITKFKLEGFEAILGNNGEEGLALAKAEIPDIILLDIMMPKMNGFDVLENLKKDSRLKNIPIVMLSNLSQKDEIERCLSMGADDYLIKAHFMPSEVVAKIKKTMEKSS